MAEMNAPESRPDHRDVPVLTSNWLRGGESTNLLIRWGAVLFCALFWLGFLALIAYADKL
jgi:hypothetical protein